MSDSFALRHLGISAAAVLALALSACRGGGGGGPVAELAAAPASEGAAGPVDRDSAAAGAAPRAGEGGGSPPVEPGAGEGEPGAPVGEAPGVGGPSAPGGGSTSSGAAMWHVFGEVGAGTALGDAGLVTSDELAGVSEKAVVMAATHEPDSDHWYRGYGLEVSPATAESGLWRITRREGLVYAETDSGLTQSSRLDVVNAGLYSGSIGSFRHSVEMAADVGHDALGAVTYRLERMHEIFGGNNDPLRLLVLDSEAEGANVRKWSSDGGKGAVFRHEDSGGSLWAAVTTDVSGPGDTDWLATGMWAYTPANGAAVDYWFGVFADGGEPIWDRFYNNRDSLTGVATYAGGASGVYTRPVDGSRRTDFFEADVTLTADFSARIRYVDNGRVVGHGHYGTFSGSVSNFEIADEAIAGAPVLTLEGRLSNANTKLHGYAGGRTSMSFGGDEWGGNWGIRFFGEDKDDDGAPPLSVAGTFGATVAADVSGLDPASGERRGIHPNATDLQAFVGAFGAYRTAWEDTPVRREDVEVDDPDV